MAADDAFTIHVKFAGHTRPVEAEGRDTVGTITDKASAALHVERGDITLYHDGTILGGNKQCVKHTIIGEGSEVEARPSKRFNSRRALEEIGLKWEGVDLLQYVAGEGSEVDPEVVKLMLEAGADPCVISTPTGVTPMEYACKGSMIQVVEYFLEAGVDPGATCSSGNSYLHLACLSNAAGVVKRLLAAGANPNPIGLRNATPLILAAGTNLDIIKALITAGADHSAADEDNGTTLHYAAEMGRAETVRYLLEAGADPNACDVDASTPLHYATVGGCLDSVTCLLRAGAQPNATNLSGCTPVNYASDGGHDAMTTALKNACSAGAL